MKIRKIPRSAAEMTGYQLGMLVDARLSFPLFWKEEKQVYARPYAMALEDLQKAGLLKIGKGASTYIDEVERLHLSKLGGRVRESILDGMPTSKELKEMIGALNRDPTKTLGEVINPDFCSRPFKDIQRDIEYEEKYALKSQIPGHIQSVGVAKGDKISEGQVLFTIESMMMTLSIKAHKSGVVRNVCVRKGETVKRDQALLYLA